MKCRYCGSQIPEGELYCTNCGKEVRIVPDYNPLDDVLAAHIKGGIEGTDRPLDDYDYEQVQTSELRRNSDLRNTGRRTNIEKNTGRKTAGRNRVSSNTGRRAVAGRNTQRQKYAASSGRGKTGRTAGKPEVSRTKRRRRAERKRALRRKRRNLILIMIAVGLLIIGGISFLLYQNSYAGQMNKGNKALAAGQYEAADGYYKKAIQKNPRKTEAYDGRANVCMAQDDADGAEEIYLSAIDKYSSETALYEACIKFYMDTLQPEQVSVILEDADDSVRTALKEYVSEPPSFSLDDEKEYDDVQQLTLTTDGEAIYYTTDGTEPTTSSEKYTKPIQIGEGKTEIQAISVNEKGVPSLAVSKEYLVEFPIEDAPAVNPSTGQYDVPTEIEIQVPDGYTAYYTMNGEDPTESSTKYTGPVDMPEGSTLFKAILINASGHVSGITTRNYELVQ